MQSEIGEILAGSRRIEPRFGYVARGIDLYAHTDAHNSMNGSEGFFGSVGQNLLEDLSS